MIVFLMISVTLRISPSLRRFIEGVLTYLFFENFSDFVRYAIREYILYLRGVDVNMFFKYINVGSENEGKQITTVHIPANMYREIQRLMREYAYDAMSHFIRDSIRYYLYLLQKHYGNHPETYIIEKNDKIIFEAWKLRLRRKQIVIA